MVAAYNPQQWGRNGPIGGQYVPHSSPQSATVSNRQREITGMEANMPSPPPPYSPGQGQSMSQTMGSSPHLSGNAFTSSHSASPSEYTPSSGSSIVVPQRTSSGYDLSRPSSVTVPNSASNATSPPSFPPPPPLATRDRSSSRSDKQHSIFSLSALTSRNRASEYSQAPSAIESLRINTTEALARAPVNGSQGPRVSQSHISIIAPERRWSPESPARPPASRRAASTGAIGIASASNSRTPIEGSPIPPSYGWGPGMPLPPPPPGPPPSSSRSQSMSRTPDTFSRSENPTAAPPTRRPTQMGSTLGPIPPTPVGWQDEDARNRSRSPAARGLHLDTSSQSINPQTNPVTWPDTASGNTSSIPGPPAAQSASSSAGGLSRAPAKRDPSARGIRERRSESRAARERTSEAPSARESNNNPWAQDMEVTSAKPSDLVLTGPTDGSIGRRRGVTKGTPRSSRNFQSPRDAQMHTGSKKSYEDLQDPGSSNSTPRLESTKRVMSPEIFAPTPPFSPGTDRFDHMIHNNGSPAVPPKTLPTPPPQHLGDDYSSSLSVSSLHQARPISHILHTPNIEANAMPAPLSPVRPQSAGLNTSTPKPSEREMFAQSAIERHRLFIEKENVAQTDQERLELFAEFIVTESRLRRDRYSSAFDAMASDILDLTRDLWRSYGAGGKRSVTPSASTTATTNGRVSQASTIEESPDTRTSAPTTAASPSSSKANYTPHTEPNSPSSASSQGRGRESQAWNSYQPCLSPIPSMTVSTVHDDEDSRGRSASRWWEASADGGSSGRGGKKLERSKRESKYMGLPREAREHLQWEDEGSPAYGPGPSSQQLVYGPNDFPVEKTGLHDHVQPVSAHSFQFYSHSAPATPDPYKLDVSRLVTLPPPYPRHYPAVNNNHPDLASIRANLRSLSDLEGVAPTKEHYVAKIDVRREQERTQLAERRSDLRYNIQENIRSGIMSFADAAKAEAEFEAREDKRTQEMVQMEFDIFQKDVATPLHAMFSERITKASASIDHLRSGLFNDARESNPNQTQEEGDEQPELLEKLTLIKWLFEAREQLHREMFELEDERNDRYKSIVLTPYVQAGNDEKVKEANDFFKRDAQDRKLVFEKETLKRFEDFLNVIEENVTRGVEIQLSAFWDIAPGLLAIVQKVPSKLDGFDILIPPQEYEENPSYHDFPLQYLFSLLAHAGKSAYQFIESQVNLLCLLHEVKTGVMTAGSRLLETQRYLAGEDFASIDREMKAIRQDEEARLTEDLKEKVALVEGQWGEALGKGLEDCKNRVEAFLDERGGWDESLKE